MAAPHRPVHRLGLCRLTEGLAATYSRAVALAGDHLLVSASSGPRGREAAIYRRTLDGADPFEKCRDGLPEWFDENIDTFCLAARRDHAVFATPKGAVYDSTDEGRSWAQVAAIPGGGVRCIVLS